MNKPDKIGEPSMDEILSSIRKIIAEEPIGSRQPQSAPEPEGPEVHSLKNGGSEGHGVSPSLDLPTEPQFGGAAQADHAQDPSLNGGPTLSFDRGAASSAEVAESLGPTLSDVRSEPVDQTAEPSLPMPGSGAKPNGGGPLSSRLADALRGDDDVAKNTNLAVETPLDDDDLEAALQPAVTPTPETVSEQPTPPSEDLASAPVNEVADSTAPSARDDLAPGSVPADRVAEMIAPTRKKVPTPEAQDDAAAVQPPAQDQDTAAGLPEADIAASQAAPDSHAPLFDDGPQPPSHLRPRSFSSDDEKQVGEDPFGDAGEASAGAAGEPPLGIQSVDDVATASDESGLVLPRSSAFETPDVESNTSDGDAAGVGVPVEDATPATSDDDGPVVIAAMDVASEPPVATPDVVADADESEAGPSVAGDDGAALASLDALDGSGDVSEEAEPVEEAQAPDAGQSAESQPQVIAATSTEQAAAVEAQNVVSAAAAATALATTVDETHAPKTTTVTTTLSASGVQTLEDTVAELLRPLLREWLAENMPRIVEKALRIEMADTQANRTDADNG